MYCYMRIGRNREERGGGGGHDKIVKKVSYSTKKKKTILGEKCMCSRVCVMVRVYFSVEIALYGE